MFYRKLAKHLSCCQYVNSKAKWPQRGTRLRQQKSSRPAMGILGGCGHKVFCSRHRYKDKEGHTLTCCWKEVIWMSKGKKLSYREFKRICACQQQSRAWDRHGGRSRRVFGGGGGVCPPRDIRLQLTLSCPRLYSPALTCQASPLSSLQFSQSKTKNCNASTTAPQQTSWCQCT